MEQNCEKLDRFAVEVKLALYAEQLFVQLIQVEDRDKPALMQVQVVVEQDSELVQVQVVVELDGF
jgi:hypothetical protein